MPDNAIDRTALAADLERGRADFHYLLDNTRPGEWDQPTHGTRWTNEQLLFHMVFGYMIVRALLVLARILGRLPAPVSRAYARLLDAAAVPFDAINYHGARLGARIFDRHRMGAQFDRTLDALQRSLAHERDSDLGRGMHYPVRWDPYFHDYMTLADIYAYPGRHYNHHRRQLTLAAAT